MSRLVWDAIGEHLYETGVDRVVLYKYSNQAYGNGVAWNGVTALNESPSGAEASPLYADNIKYLNLISAEEYGATLEAYYSPEEFDECDGSAEIATGVTIGQQTRKKFGLCYRTLIGNDLDGTDKGYKIHIIYNASAAPSSRDHGTVNDNPDASTLSWEISTTPVNVSGHKPTATVVIDSTKVPAAKLTALEDILYGTVSAEPRLPLPDEIIDIVGNAGSLGVDIVPSSASIVVGDSFMLSAQTNPAGKQVTWTTSDSSKVTVSASGAVTGVEAGSATVTATLTYGGSTYTDTCSVTVTSAS